MIQIIKDIYNIITVNLTFLALLGTVKFMSSFSRFIELPVKKQFLRITLMQLRQCRNMIPSLFLSSINYTMHGQSLRLTTATNRF